MQTVTSVSGGKTSAYLSANYPADRYVFSLVRTNDESCKYKDRKLAQMVEDRIQKPFIGTLEDDVIIHTIFDLEQYIGKTIDWVSGDTFENIIDKKQAYLPNVMTRYCTTHMKLNPIFNWWHENFDEPIYMNIGYRITEKSRANNMEKKLIDGFDYYKASFEKHADGRNKWENVKWRIPKFPLVDDYIDSIDIHQFWKNKNVRFAYMNNCIGCFHRSASLLNKMSKMHPSKFDWFIKQETRTTNQFKKNVSYKKIKESNFTMNIPFDYDPEGCDSGFCGM